MLLKKEGENRERVMQSTGWRTSVALGCGTIRLRALSTTTTATEAVDGHFEFTLQVHTMRALSIRSSDN